MLAGVLLAASTAGNPSWLWYATRGLGASTLLVLTATVVLGILTATRWSGEQTPGFVAVDLHRNLSLIAMFLLLAHIVTTVLDPFAHISVRDVLIPVGAAYRPVWLGLGVAAFWVLVAVAATSLLRDRIGVRVWRIIHWAAYLSWPLALIHGLGTGSDGRAPWLVSLTASCSAAVVVAIAERLRDGRLITLPIRGLAAMAVIAFFVGAGVWAAGGPFQPGWSAKAGTPPVKTVAVKGPVHPGPGGFSDPLVGVLARDSAGNMSIALRDTVDPDLTITIRSPNIDETLPVMTIARSGKTLCTVPASVNMNLYAVCGKTRLTVTFFGSDAVLKTGGPITGRLDTSGPLN
ncbi:MAG TPA: ferric reductase-like transmembrane domain-containing protein [Candidatus Limnocylindrales bacterium]|nr:ferric reductase-like transmembrane domain-containing protein [Candidatus Limnocylindrales bacterium]